MALLNRLANNVKGIKDYTLSELPDNFIKNMLDAEDSIPEKSRAGTYSGYVHVSSLSGNFCARQYAIAQHEKLNLYETLTGGHKVTFKIGRAVEDHIRTSIINRHGRQNIFACWTCDCQKDNEHPEEGTYRIGLWKSAVCKCGKPLDNFREPAIRDEENGVVGRADLILYYQKTLHITEIKSIKKDAWEELIEPLESHVKQNIFYPPLLSELGYPVSPNVTFIYCTKDFKWGSPYKSFVVNTSEPRHVRKREELLAEAKEVKEFLQSGKSPPRICLTENGPLAKKCPVSFRCFNVYKDDIK